MAKEREESAAGLGGRVPQRETKAEGEVGKRPARNAGKGPEHEPGTPGHRREIVNALINVMGMKPDRAAREYDAQLAMWYAQEGITPPGATDAAKS